MVSTLHENTLAATTVENLPAPETQSGGASPLRSRYLAYSGFLLVIIVSASAWFALALQEPDAKLVAAIVLTGACGGILFAVRESVLTWPRLDGNSIHLGWIADCAFGVAGAFSVFLLVPGLSESAREGFITLFSAPAEATSDSAMDLIEVIAVALVGGFAGRSVMQHAQENVLSAKSDSAPSAVNQPADESPASIESVVAATNEARTIEENGGSRIPEGALTPGEDSSSRPTAADSSSPDSRGKVNKPR